MHASVASVANSRLWTGFDQKQTDSEDGGDEEGGLLEVMEDFTTFLDKHECNGVVYLDFNKVFDSVPHKRLLIKLESYGITGKILRWIHYFLSNRQQRVGVGNVRLCTCLS